MLSHSNALVELPICQWIDTVWPIRGAALRVSKSEQDLLDLDV